MIKCLPDIISKDKVSARHYLQGYCLPDIISCDKICIWYPFECDMGLDGTLTSHIERVADEFDMACQSAI